MALYAFDGTWNVDEEEDGQDSNVTKFKELYQGQDVEYIEGVGTRFGAVGRALGGVLGIGGRSRIEEMENELIENWEGGDETIDIIGFSRGAALAVHFANKIGDEGIKLSNGEKVSPGIRFLGLWDVVGSFGLSFDTIVNFQEINLGWDLDTVAECVRHCYHAMAMDERRETFGLTRLDLDNTKDNVTEMWFRGVHSDVGGGNNNPKRSNIALQWMIENAVNCGVGINRVKARKEKYSKIDRFAKISENSDIKVDPRRDVPEGDARHLTADPFTLGSNESHAFQVNSEYRYNWSGVYLEKGKSYRIESDEIQIWKDGGINCGPTGWESSQLNWFKEEIVSKFEDDRRCPEANWFELVGAYGDEDNQLFRIGSDTTFTAQESGDLYTFANDLNSKYGNNEGSVQARITCVS